jgi:hypothetical protein
MRISGTIAIPAVLLALFASVGQALNVRAIELRLRRFSTRSRVIGTRAMSTRFWRVTGILRI